MIAQFSASNLCLSSFDAAVDAASQAGFYHLSVSFTRDQFVKDLHELDEWESEEMAYKVDLYGIRIVTTATRSNVLTDAGVADLQKAIRVTARLGADVLDIPSLRLAEDQRTDETRLFSENLRRAADVAQAVGVVLCLETRGMTGTPEGCLETLASINHPQVGIAFDPAVMVCREGVDPLESLDHLLPFIGHVHAKDCAGGGKDAEFSTVGRGNLDWGALLNRLGEGGFGGFVSVDYVSGNTDDERAAELMDAHEFLVQAVT